MAHDVRSRRELHHRFPPLRAFLSRRFALSLFRFAVSRSLFCFGFFRFAFLVRSLGSFFGFALWVRPFGSPFGFALLVRR
jgi:hypothetical protein